MNSNCPPQAFLHAVCGVLFAAALVMPPNPRLRILETQQAYSTIISNAYVVKNAAERIAEIHFQMTPEDGRVYPVLGDFWPYFPNGGLLLNPVTGARSEPSGADATGSPGAVGYRRIGPSEINGAGYTIDVFGWTSTLWRLAFVPSHPPQAKSTRRGNDAARN